MEPNVETFLPSRQYVRFGWAALAGSLVCVLCGFGAPLAFVPALLCATTAAAIFWLAARPAIRVGETQFNVGERCIAFKVRCARSTVAVSTAQVLSRHSFCTSN